MKQIFYRKIAVLEYLECIYNYCLFLTKLHYKEYNFRFAELILGLWLN